MRRKLIGEIKKHPILYDLEHTDYKDPAMKEVIWQQIGLTMNTEPDKCKMCWKNLRDTYRKHKKRLVSRSGKKSRFGRPWKFAQYMEFLENSKSFRNNTWFTLRTTIDYDDMDELTSPSVSPVNQAESDDDFMDEMDDASSFTQNTLLLDTIDVDGLKEEKDMDPLMMLGTPPPVNKRQSSKRCKRDENGDDDDLKDETITLTQKILSVDNTISVLKSAKDILSSGECAKRKTSTAQMFESLETSIDELKLSPENREEIENKIWNFVRSQIKYYRKKSM